MFNCISHTITVIFPQINNTPFWVYFVSDAFLKLDGIRWPLSLKDKDKPIRINYSIVLYEYL